MSDRCARDFIIVLEPGKSPYIKRGDAHGDFGTVVMLQLLADIHPEGTRYLVATVPSGGDDLWVESGEWHLNLFNTMASRKTKRDVRDRLAKERAAPWHTPRADANTVSSQAEG